VWSVRIFFIGLFVLFVEVSIYDSVRGHGCFLAPGPVLGISLPFLLLSPPDLSSLL